MALKDVSFMSLALFFMIFCVHCDAETHITYKFPSDSCYQDSYSADENKVIHVKFDGGDIGEPSCRQMRFKLKKSFLYRYHTCVWLLYFDSPRCTITAQVHRQFIDYYGYYDIDKIVGDGCPDGTYYNYDRCFDSGKYVTLGLRRQVNNNYRMDRNKPSSRIAPNSTFEFKIVTRKEIDGETVGIIAGVSAGVIIALVAGVCIFIRCKRKKRRTGSYCNASIPSALTSETLRDRLSEGLSAEFAVAGVLICSCICCRGQRRQAEEPTKPSQQSNIKPTHNETTESSFEEEMIEPDAPLLQYS